jgi:CBS domain containing-hemolysin-like protein
MYALAWPIQVSLHLARAIGVVWLLRQVAHLLARRAQREPGPFEEEVLPRARTLWLLREGAASGGLTTLQRDLMGRVMKISRTVVADVMISRERVAAVARDIPRDDFLRIARMAHFSRLPVHAGDSRRIVGIVNVFDVLTDAQRQPVTAHLRDAFRLTPGTSVAAALLRLQQARQAMAIVEDRRGLSLGVLTVKDLVEEIIGDFDVW